MLCICTFSCKCGGTPTSKLIEMVPNVVGLVIVPSIFVVNELYSAWKEKEICLDGDTGRQVK